MARLLKGNSGPAECTSEFVNVLRQIFAGPSQNRQFLLRDEFLQLQQAMLMSCDEEFIEQDAQEKFLQLAQNGAVFEKNYIMHVSSFYFDTKGYNFAHEILPLAEKMRDIAFECADMLDVLPEEQQMDEKHQKSVYDKAFRACGGQDEVDKWSKWSSTLSEQLNSLWPMGPSQDFEYQMLSIEELYVEAERVRPAFLKLVSDLAERTGGMAVKADMKPRARASAKVKVLYGDDVSRLCDVVRSALVFSNIRQMYSACEAIIKSPEVNRPTRYIMGFEDRFREPIGPWGFYRDLKLTVVVDQHACELKLFTKPIRDILVNSAEGMGHFEEFRKINEELLQAAVQNDSEKILSRLTPNKDEIFVANPNAACDAHGQRSMHFAATHGNNDICEKLLEHGANVLTPDRIGDLPPTRALQHGHLKVAKMLLENLEQELQAAPKGAKADPILQRRINPRLEELFDWAMDKAQSDERYLPFLHLLLTCGVEVNRPLVQGPPGLGQPLPRLHYVAWRGVPALVSVLIDADADVNAKDAFGQTALEVAVKEHHSAVANFLAKRQGVICDEHGEPNSKAPKMLLHMAAESGLAGEAGLLCAAKADITTYDQNYLTPLHLAAQRGNKTTFRTILGGLNFKAHVARTQLFARRRLQAQALKHFEVDYLSPIIEDLKEPMEAAFEAHQGALKEARSGPWPQVNKMFAHEERHFLQLMHIDSEKRYNRRLIRNSDSFGMKPDELRHGGPGAQVPESAAHLREQALNAHMRLKQILAPNTEWAAASRSELPDWPPITWTEECWIRNGLVEYVSEAYDLGVESVARIEQRAQCHHDGKFYAVPGISRLVLQYSSCRNILDALLEIKRHFTVVEVRNHFNAPTVLGWRELLAYVEIPVDLSPVGSKHICELHIQHKAFGTVQRKVAKHLGRIREILAKASLRHLDELLRMTLDFFSAERVENEVNVPDGDGWTCLDHLVESGHSTAMARMVQTCGGVHSLFWAQKRSDWRLFETLLEASQKSDFLSSQVEGPRMRLYAPNGQSVLDKQVPNLKVAELLQKFKTS